MGGPAAVILPPGPGPRQAGSRPRLRSAKLEHARWVRGRDGGAAATPPHSREPTRDGRPPPRTKAGPRTPRAGPRGSGERGTGPLLYQERLQSGSGPGARPRVQRRRPRRAAAAYRNPIPPPCLSVPSVEFRAGFPPRGPAWTTYVGRSRGEHPHGPVSLLADLPAVMFELEVTIPPPGTPRVVDRAEERRRDRTSFPHPVFRPLDKKRGNTIRPVFLTAFSCFLSPRPSAGRSALCSLGPAGGGPARRLAHP